MKKNLENLSMNLWMFLVDILLFQDPDPVFFPDADPGGRNTTYYLFFLKSEVRPHDWVINLERIWEITNPTFTGCQLLSRSNKGIRPHCYLQVHI